ncbi:MAG TPA: hypothetical protein VIG73_05480 [Cerasibacillus sp.]|uniref:hypothetical protein n=1 Tax=Cerasibacillus sp. TaxID=2498711 RepID=UPI002F3F91A3
MKTKNLFRLILIAVALGASIATLVLNMMKSIEVSSAITLLSIGIICLALLRLQEQQ